jgi:holo-[acyl-carrier protein] synthase
MVNNNILGIGIDLESISRFKKIERYKNKNFLNNIFTKKEIEYCYAQKDPSRHLAGRYAAKESIIKAFGRLDKKIFYNEIEIIRRKNGSLHASLANTLDKYDILISMSHAGKDAIAIALITK